MASVLIVGEYGALNGGEHSLMTVIPALQEAGFELTACVPANSDFANALSELGIGIEPVSYFDSEGVRLSQDSIRLLIANVIQRIKPDLVHANSLSTSRLVGPVTNELGVPGLGHFRDILKLSKKAISDLNELDKIVTVSQATKDFHANQGIEIGKLEVVYNGVDLERFSPDALDQQFAKETEEPRLLGIREELSLGHLTQLGLFVGQIGMRKGIELLLEVFGPLCHEHERLNLLIVGQRHSMKQEAIDYEERLRQMAKDCFPPRRVHWLGRRSDVAQIMRQSDLLVHPAKQEPLGRVLLEAAATGLPIVTTNVGGSPEILKGLESFLFSPDQFANSKDTINQLLLDSKFAAKTSLSLRARAEIAFSMQASGSHLVSVYQSLV